MRAASPALLLSLSLSAVAVVQVTTGCVREGAAVLAPVDVTIESADGGPSAPLVVSAPPPAPRDRCTTRLRVAPIKTKDGCTLDERISHGNGTLFYPCSGEGPAEAVFGEHRFVGRLADGTMSLALTTELDWEDGCHWETKQSIRGELKREPGKRARLVWSYSEAPVTGTSCFGSCRATADIDADELTP